MATPDLDDVTPEQETLLLRAGKVFTPNTPVNDNDLFAGRYAEILRVCDVINQAGQHAVIYGERGVGKTSLANILATKIHSSTGATVLAPRVNCDSADTFGSIWRKVFSQVDLIQQKRAAGFEATIFQETIQAASVVPLDPSPEDVRRFLTLLGEGKLLYVIIDEFDTVTDTGARRAMANAIKTLSDHDVPATLIVIGVADSIEQLIAEHQSIDRAVEQIKLPRMNRQAINDLLTKGTGKLGMGITAQAQLRIALLAQGLPHHAQLLGLHSTRAAILTNSKTIEVKHVSAAIEPASASSHHMLRSGLRKAITSPQKDNLYGDVLLACAMARTDEFGFFYAADVRGPLSKIKGRPIDIPNFAKHLNDFCQESRGPVLEKHGEKRRFQYRFDNPLLQPLIIMKGITDRKITEGDLEDESNRAMNPVH